MNETNDPGISSQSPGVTDREFPEDSQEGWPVRAVMAGTVAALVGGAAWALIAVLVNLELGYVAWGIGFLVGFAMMRATDFRGTIPAATASGLAMVGLLSGKLMIVELVTGDRLVEEVTSTPELMEQAAFFDLRVSDGWSDSVSQGLSGLAETDTLPDALWEAMRTEAGQHVAGATETERTQMATAFRNAVMADVGLLERVRSQLNLFDLLWFGLALTTAWRMLTGQPEDAT